MVKANVAAAVDKLHRVRDAMQRAASPETRRKAAEKIGDMVMDVVKQAITDNIGNGGIRTLARISVEVTGDGITLHAPPFMNAHPWWPFRDGMPEDVKRRAQEILAETTREAMR